MSDITDMTIAATDGYQLALTHYHAEQPRAVLIMAGATGVPQGFYRRFAEFVAGHGYDVLTVDYRGIGRSAPKTLRGFEMDYLDWAHKDLVSVMDYAQQTKLPLLWAGHSFGGHAAGLMPDADKVVAAWFFGVGAGWHGWMPKGESMRVQIMWNAVAPIVTRIYGFLNWKLLGMGENLPLGVYRDWKHWCRFPHYFFDDPQMQHVHQKFLDFSAPIVAVNALDDKWASGRSRAAFLQGYKNSHVENLDPNPAEYGAIGHMGYFRSSCSVMWKQMIEWMDSRLSAAGAPQEQQSV